MRKGLGTSAAALDTLCGYATGTVGRLERGDQRLYASHLYRIAEAAGVEVGFFFAGIDVERVDGAEETLSALAGPAEREARQILAAYLSISDRQIQHDVFDLIRALARESERTT